MFVFVVRGVRLEEICGTCEGAREVWMCELEGSGGCGGSGFRVVIFLVVV